MVTALKPVKAFEDIEILKQPTQFHTFFTLKQILRQNISSLGSFSLQTQMTTKLFDLRLQIVTQIVILLFKRKRTFSTQMVHQVRIFTTRRGEFLVFAVVCHLRIYICVTSQTVYSLDLTMVYSFGIVVIGTYKRCSINL